MKLIEADKVKRVMKDYWKAQVDKALTLTFIDGNEANKRINSYLEHNHELLKAIDELPPTEPYTIHSDGRLWVTVDDIDKVNAVVVDESKSKFCKQFYMDVQPERKTGQWIKSDMQRWYDVWLCSECGEKTDSAVMSKPRYKYCPMCGAKMERGEQE